MSYADLALFDVSAIVGKALPEVALPCKLKAVVEKVKADPKISAYMEKKSCK